MGGQAPQEVHPEEATRQQRADERGGVSVSGAATSRDRSENVRANESASALRGLEVM